MTDVERLWDRLTEEYNISPSEVREHYMLETREDYLRMVCELRKAGWTHEQVLEVMKMGMVVEAFTSQASMAFKDSHPAAIIAAVRWARDMRSKRGGAT